MIIAKLDVLKIEKAKLFKGQKGLYLDIVLIPTPNGQYGDYMVCQSISKDEREAGVKGAILGNGKNVGGGNRQSHRSPPPQENPDEDCPF